VYTRSASFDTDFEVMFPSELDSPTIIVSASGPGNPALHRSTAPLTG
jgi:hypothetical protein